MNRRIVALMGAVVMASACLLVAPASAQVQESVLTAEAECAPDGSTQGVVFTFVNHEGLSVDIDFADAEGSAFGDVPYATDYDNYREAGNGVKVPYTIHIVGPTRPDCAAITIDKVQLNVAIDNSKFAKPESRTP